MNFFYFRLDVIRITYCIYTVIFFTASIILITDTVFVYGYPDTANVIYDTINTIMYTATNAFAMQWYYYNSPIPNATDTFYEPTTSGLYSITYSWVFLFVLRFELQRMKWGMKMKTLAAQTHTVKLIFLIT